MSSWLNTRFKEDSMTRVEISRTKRLQRKKFWKEFNKNFIKKYLKFLSYLGLATVGIIAFMHLWVGATNQNYDHLEQVRKNDPFYVKSN
jgi:ATP-dependent Zn protease